MVKGTVYESLSFFSPTLERDLKYSIYLPPKYERDSRKYSTIYLLHGHSGNEVSWIRKGHVDQTLDIMINLGEIPPFVVVMPDAKNSWYVDSPVGEKYETAIINDLIGFIEGHYKVRKTRGDRFVAGLSMGGYGALKLAFKHPDMFLSAASLSGGIMRDVPPETDVDINGDLIHIREDYYHDVFGDPFDPDFWEEENVFNWVDNVKNSGLTLPVYLSCGNEDYYYLYLGSTELYHELRLAKIESVLYIRDGDHNWLLWQEDIKEVLRFFKRALDLY